MSVIHPEPANTKKMEPKVKWQAIATYIVGAVGLAIFNAVTDSNLISELPDAIEIFAVPLVPVLGGLLAGFNASHQWRSGEFTAPPAG